MNDSTKPSVFVASSTEGLDVAYAVQENLQHDAEITVWPQGVFKISEYSMVDLLNQLPTYDFAIFVFADDDIATLRDEEVRVVRDNVVFELGVCAGSIGRRRCFVLAPKDIPDLHLPSDLLGLKPGRYESNRSDENVLAALGPACNEIRRAVERLGRKVSAAEGPVRPSRVHPSPRTPESALLDELVSGALQTVCRAVSVPETPESAQLRVFIFKNVNNSLVCSHYWAPNPVKELVGRLRFPIEEGLADRVAVVKCAIQREITRTGVAPLPEEVQSDTGEVSDELSYVLSAPILNYDDALWGTVDFDASNEKGRELLSTEVSEAAMFQLSRHLRLIFSLDPESDEQN